MLKSSSQTYGRVSQIFHWTVALLVLSMLPMGILISRMDDSTFRTLLYQTHVAIGIFILVIEAARLLWRISEPTPDIPEDMPRWNQLAYRGTHYGLHLLTLIMAGSGIAALLASGTGLFPWNVTPASVHHAAPLRVHDIVSKLYILLFLAHFGGVLLHQFTKSDVLSRMGWRWWPTRINNP
ncbi:MAG: hypothetical protein DWQ07_02890 [Chloroflexi bacterium]|nr:MAG: hypothetical protein DWQ07_02890 [Chloroflexota bacterium]MBL1193553.1 hypothetical protein [Chloroflexota bacterium]NOH10844.1 hypothetical protein [Chloroflexota bacterium]